jgi:APA family basic amino acid/polyamine antiporter
MPGFRRALGTLELTALGLGAIIGAGIFVVTGTASAQFAGPAIVLSFLVAGLGCLCVALCYAEFAAMLPVAGSAYRYSFAAFGRFGAWMIGWQLMLEFILGGATIAVVWSAYVTQALAKIGIVLPSSLTGGFVNLPAVLLITMVTAVLAVGIRAASTWNGLLTLAKIALIVLMIVVGLAHVVPDNWRPFIPENGGSFGRYGWSGVLRGAAAVFFAFIGFDVVTSVSQEAKHPERDVPFALLASLGVAVLLYVLMALVLTGLTHYPQLNAPHPLESAAAAAGLPAGLLSNLVNLAIIAGLASVTLVLLMGQPRVMYAMARDGMLPERLADISPKYQTPVFGTLVTGGIAALVAGFVPLGIFLDAVNVATLIAFAAVCLGIVVHRYREPRAARPFRVPLVPLVPLVGLAFSVGTMFGVYPETWSRVAIWNVVGLALYFVSRKRRGIH